MQSHWLAQTGVVLRIIRTLLIADGLLHGVRDGLLAHFHRGLGEGLDAAGDTAPILDLMVGKLDSGAGGDAGHCPGDVEGAVQHLVLVQSGEALGHVHGLAGFGEADRRGVVEDAT